MFIRDCILDSYRGVILLVTLSHTCFTWSKYFTFFDVQIFFFLSGVFLSGKNNIENSLVKKTKGLVYPYIFFSVPLYLIAVFIRIFKHSSVSDISFLYPNSFFLGTEWFLIVLFLCTFVYLFLNQFKNAIIKVLTIIIIFFISYYNASLGVFKENYLTMTGLCLPLLYLGSCYKRYVVLINDIKILTPLLSLTSFAVLAYYCSKGLVINIPTTTVPKNPIDYFIATIAGIILLLNIFIVIHKYNENRIVSLFEKLLAYLGFNSLFIFILHWPITISIYYKYILPSYPQDIICVLYALAISLVTGYCGHYFRKIKVIF